MAYILSLLFVALLVCKLTGLLAIGWLIVFLPIIIFIVWMSVVVLTGVLALVAVALFTGKL
jgi:hypothetical protein